MTSKWISEITVWKKGRERFEGWGKMGGLGKKSGRDRASEN